MFDESDPRLSVMDQSEMKLAKVLLRNNKMTEDQLNNFLSIRADFEKSGKRYLGDILVHRGYVKQEDIDEFFSENNQMYIKFLDRLIEEGFLSEEQRDEILADELSKQNVVAVLEKGGIMTKESFIKLFSKRVNSLRLGDWLLAKRKLSEETLKKALQEQSANRLEDYLVFHGIAKKDLIEGIKKKLNIV